jgi:ribosome-binding protein aMBF1 (putative translation factor)
MVAKRRRRASVAKARSRSPIGSTTRGASRRRARRSAAYREAQERLAPYEQLARIVIRRRMDLGLTQEELASRMGTSYSAISRIESGQHSTSVQTLQRLAAALEMRFVMGFEHGPAEKPVRELVSA